jgi:hypothetical protein
MYVQMDVSSPVRRDDIPSSRYLLFYLARIRRMKMKMGLGLTRRDEMGW